LYSYFTVILIDDVDLSDIHLVVLFNNMLLCSFIGH